MSAVSSGESSCTASVLPLPTISRSPDAAGRRVWRRRLGVTGGTPGNADPDDAAALARRRAGVMATALRTTANSPGASGVARCA